MKLKSAHFMSLKELLKQKIPSEGGFRAKSLIIRASSRVFRAKNKIIRAKTTVFRAI
jgi:hypothetical protein